MEDPFGIFMIGIQSRQKLIKHHGFLKNVTYSIFNKYLFHV